ncbi:MAG: dCMP deaminase [Acidimicrobiales bacterium]|jgi:dCMP deaminase
MSRKIAIAYIPVLHKGYFDFLNELTSQGVQELFLIGDVILGAHKELDYINRKDRLRALSLETVKDSLSAVTSLTVKELTPEVIQEIQDKDVEIFTPREDIGRVVVEAYFKDKEVGYLDIFLRWNRDNTGEEKTVEAHKTISLTDFQKEVFADVLNEAENATDWWRQVGAALVKDGEVLFVTHNEHMPEKEMPAIIGDTRALFKRGINVNYVTSAHAEVVAIAEAAKRGIVTEGAEMYLTDFPCPYCARLIAKAGIKKVYFMKGYAVLEGDEFLKGEGVEVIRVEIT